MRKRAPNPQRCSLRRRGMTLLEIMLAAVVLSVAILGLVSSALSTSHLADLDREDQLAADAAQAKFTEMESYGATNFAGLFANYSSPWVRTFPVPGLIDGSGTILFPTDASGRQLREDAVDFGPAMRANGRDLNGDGQPPDFADHRGDYTILPVAIQITWTTVGGAARSVKYTTLLAKLYRTSPGG
jgi:prepilin-type N-terminal cleavage/methylation domain-containing protein